MGFFIALAGMEREALFAGSVSCAALWQVFLYRYSKKEEIFFIRCEAKNVYSLTMGSLSARRDYDIIYTTMSTPFTRRRMTHWGSVPRCHSCDAPSFKDYNPLNLLPIGMGLWR